MKALWGMGLVLFFTSQLFAQEICIQSFNIYGPAYAPTVSERTYQFVRKLSHHSDCSVIHIQEVWLDKHQEQLQNLIEDTLPAFKTFVPDWQRQDGWMTGLFQLFKGQLLESSSQKYPVNKDGWTDRVRDAFNVTKGFSINRYQFGKHSNWGPVEFVNTHLHPSSHAVRLTQVLELHKNLRFSRHPVVLTGDLNAIPESLEVKFLQTVGQFRDVFAENSPCTYCKDNPISWSNEDRKIDHILVRHGDKQGITFTDPQIVYRGSPQAPLSDHYGVEVWLQLTESRKKTSQNGHIQILYKIIEILEQEARQEFDPYIEYALKLMKKYTIHN